MRIAVVVYGEIIAPVVRSQTFPLLAELRRAGHDPHLVVFTSPRRVIAPGRWRDALDAARTAAGGNLVVATHLPRHRGFGFVAGRLRRILRAIAPDVVHARQSRAGLLAARAAVAPVVLDLRGIRPEEYLLSLRRGEGSLLARERRTLAALREQDREARAGAAAIVCVSEPFRARLGADDRVRVIPNAGREVETPDPAARERLRAGFGLGPSDLTFVYSGSLAAWQCAREAFRLFRELAALRGDARLVLLTHDEAGGRALLREEAVAAAAVRTLTPEDTARTLAAFDAAFLLRERDPVNEVAAPVKFGEYLHAGLPVVITEGLGDASSWVRDHGLGVVLPDPRDEGNAARVAAAIGTFDRERCRAFARERLTFARAADLYVRAYRAAAERGGGA